MPAAEATLSGPGVYFEMSVFVSFFRVRYQIAEIEHFYVDFPGEIDEVLAWLGQRL